MLPVAIALTLALLLPTWAVASEPATQATPSNLSLRLQIDEAQRRAAFNNHPKLIFLGLALDDRSDAFLGDILLAKRFAREIDPDGIFLTLANAAKEINSPFPQATLDNIREALSSIAELSRPQDKIMIVLSSHGKPGRLLLHRGDAPTSPLHASFLKEWMHALDGRQVILIISACYSGSFIPYLQEPHRIILTAAAETRRSFGCASHSDGTYFMKALLRNPFATTLSVRELVRQAELEVRSEEASLGLTQAQASDPQSFFGAAAQDWADRPIKDWFPSQPSPYSLH